jgi:hypothetical protein
MEGTRRLAGHASFAARRRTSSSAPVTVGRMPHRPSLGLFDNVVRLYSLDELTETARLLERSQPGRTVGELSNAVFAELAMKRSRRAVELVAEAIRRARSREPREDIGGSRWQAGTAEVRAWALRAGYEIPADGAIPEHAIAAYNETHPDRPLLTLS